MVSPCFTEISPAFTSCGIFSVSPLPLMIFPPLWFASLVEASCNVCPPCSRPLLSRVFAFRFRADEATLPALLNTGAVRSSVFSASTLPEAVLVKALFSVSASALAASWPSLVKVFPVSVSPLRAVILPLAWLSVCPVMASVKASLSSEPLLVNWLVLSCSVFCASSAPPAC